MLSKTPADRQERRPWCGGSAKQGQARDRWCLYCSMKGHFAKGCDHVPVTTAESFGASVKRANSVRATGRNPYYIYL